jgi:hypothetical protein
MKYAASIMCASIYLSISRLSNDVNLIHFVFLSRALAPFRAMRVSSSIGVKR